MRDEYTIEHLNPKKTLYAKKVKHGIKATNTKKHVPYVLKALLLSDEEKNADLFYSESNIKYLESLKRDIESGKSILVEHELIEEED